MTKLTAIVLTFNERLHLDRCLRSLSSVVDQIIVIDSYSTDETIEIAKHHGVDILQRKFTTHADQFNWALKTADIKGQWVLRIDADEFIERNAGEKLRTQISRLSADTAGISLNRSIVFQGRTVKFGGVANRKVLRLFRLGKGICEDRRMDEHIIVHGHVAHIDLLIIDMNLNSISWWIKKHNDYATKEAVEIALSSHSSSSLVNEGGYQLARTTKKIRILKNYCYLKSPLILRVFAYFFYRYFLRLGICDHQYGLYHILSALWYRLLVDVKLKEIQKIQRSKNIDITNAIECFVKNEN